MYATYEFALAVSEFLPQLADLLALRTVLLLESLDVPTVITHGSVQDDTTRTKTQTNANNLSIYRISCSSNQLVWY